MDSDSYSSEYANLQTPSTASSNDSAIEIDRSLLCRICGDAGIGFNFGVRTCESCKAFFRRNANRLHELKCAFANNCPIVKSTRKCCPKCRLFKCFEVGMRKELILRDADTEKQQKRPRKNTLPSQNLDSGDDFVTSPFCGSFPSFDVENAFKDYHSLMFPCNADMLNRLNLTTELFDKNRLRDFVAQRAIMSDFEYRNQRLDLETGNEWNFNQAEMFKFDELRRTAQDWRPMPFLTDEVCPNIMEGYKAMEITITKLIKMIKQWASFRVLNIDEQISLLKLVLVEMMFTSGISRWESEEPTGGYLYNEEKQSRILVKSSMMMIVSTELEHQYFVRTYYKATQVVDNDLFLVNIMVALILFRPRDFPDRRAFLENEYYSYLYILNEYLRRNTPGPVEARAKFLDIMALIEHFLTLSRVFLAILDRIDPSEISHFVKEAFNMA